MIELHTNPNDKRSATYSLTDTGYSVYNEVMKIHAQILSNLFSGISDTEKKQFLAVSDKILNNIELMLS